MCQRPLEGSSGRSGSESRACVCMCAVWWKTQPSTLSRGEAEGSTSSTGPPSVSLRACMKRGRGEGQSPPQWPRLPPAAGPARGKAAENLAPAPDWGHRAPARLALSDADQPAAQHMVGFAGEAVASAQLIWPIYGNRGKVASRLRPKCPLGAVPVEGGRGSFAFGPPRKSSQRGAVGRLCHAWESHKILFPLSDFLIPRIFLLLCSHFGLFRTSCCCCPLCVK